MAALGELGPVWSVAVMVLSGIALGLFGAVAAIGRGPLLAALGVAGCGLGYYLTQVPFFATITYPHSIIAFAAPILLLAIYSIMRTRIRQTH